MRDGWRETTLGEVATFHYGKALRSEERIAGGVPVAGSSGQFGEHDKPNVTTEQSIVVGRKGTAGSVTWFNQPAWVTDTAYWAEPRDGISLRYLRLLLEGANLPSQTAQTGVPGLNRDRAYALPLLSAPLDEQRRIVDLIAAVDDAVEAAEAEAVATSKTLAAERARVFGDPAETLLAGEAFDVAIGKQKSADKVDGSNVIPYLRSANVELGRIRVDDVLAMHFSEREAERLTLRDRDVLITEGSASEVAVGVPAVWRGELEGAVGIQNALIRVRAVPEVSTPEFAEHWAFWAYESGTFREIANGTNIKHVGVERAKLVRVPRVDVAEQPALIAHMSALRDAADAARATAESLRALRSNLLTVLLSGEHEIPSSYDALLGEVA